MMKRFTIDGDAALERRLEELCERVRLGVVEIVPAAKLEGLVLAGGYGRGEGGVLCEEGAHLPYNDMEFFVFIRGSTLLNDRRHKAALHELGERLSHEAGVEVEFKVLSLAKLRHSETSMFYYDLVMGHRWVIGDDSLLAGCGHHRDAARIPLHEATRLLFNRCSGLLFAKERLARAEFTAEDADFTGRNIAKAQLALGDALLAAQGLYHWSCRERRQRLAALHDVDAELLAHHAAGVDFKLRPSRSTLSREELLDLHDKVARLAERVFMGIESRRLGCEFASPWAYSSSGVNKCPERSVWRNFLIHLRVRGIPQRRTRYPREHLLNELAQILWGGRSATPEAVREYSALWSVFN